MRDLDLSKGRASNALSEAAGSSIQAECKKKYPKGIRHGELAVTRAGKLNCSSVFHCTLPKYSGKKEEQVDLCLCYTMVMDQYMNL